MSGRASDYAENISPGPCEEPVEDETGCIRCGAECEPGGVLCELCYADKDKERAEKMASDLCEMFLGASRRKS